MEEDKSLGCETWKSGLVALLVSMQELHTWLVHSCIRAPLFDNKKTKQILWDGPNATARLERLKKKSLLSWVSKDTSGRPSKIGTRARHQHRTNEIVRSTKSQSCATKRGKALKYFCNNLIWRSSKAYKNTSTFGHM